MVTLREVIAVLQIAIGAWIFAEGLVALIKITLRS